MAGEKILLVEYDPRTLKETKELLLKAGFNVIEAADGLAALASYEESNPDIILMSPMLPKLHGFDVCQKIKTSPKGKNVPVVIITDVYKGRKYRMDAIHLYKADDYIEKPIEDNELIKILNNLLAKYNRIKKHADKEQQIVQEKTVEIDSSKIPFNMIKEEAISKEEIKIKDSAEKQKIEETNKAKVIKRPQDKVSLDLDIEKKLADTLSGLQIDLPKFTQKKASYEEKKKEAEVKMEKEIVKPSEKVEESVKLVEEKKEEPVSKIEYPSEEILSAEDIFDEVIQKVEEEVVEKEKLEEEKPKPKIKEKKGKAVPKDIEEKITV